MSSLSLSIVLVGLPGAGKSKIARLAAQSLGVAHIDTDQLIEEEAGCSISTIFAEEGEAGFRERETRAVERALSTKAIISLGGGAVTSPRVRELLADVDVVRLSEYDDSNPAVEELRAQGITENHLVLTTNKLIRDNEPVTPYTLDEVAKMITMTALKELRDKND